jgi:hypothetical protein
MITFVSFTVTRQRKGELMTNHRRYFSIALIVFAALSRLMPHPPNFAPITALALFSGVHLRKQYTFLVPLAALLLSDLFLGFYSGMVWVYGSFMLIAILGIWLRSHRGLAQTVGATIFGSVLFFIVSNFGVWVASNGLYPHTATGLMECYTAAIPFFRNTIIGDGVYVTALFLLYEIGIRAVPSLRTETNV